MNTRSMDKVLFIVPPYVTFDRFVSPSFNERTNKKKSGQYGSVMTDMPLGVLSLSAYIKKHTSVEIRLLDFNIVLNKLESFDYRSFPELFRAILLSKEWADYSPNIIGISTLFTPSYYNMLDVARVARETFPGALILAGGSIPTNMYKEIFKSSDSFDALCYGEGEKPLRGLIEAEDRKRFLETHLSWITREKAERKRSFRHDFIEDLDEIPFLDYGLLDLGAYSLNPIQSLFPLAGEPRKSMPVLTSRGCPHHCCFCASHTVHGRIMRYHSLQRIREDFTRLKETYGVQTLVFQDDHLMSDKNRVYAIIDIMKELQLTAFFPSSLALYALDRKMLEALKSIGVNHLILSVESGSDRVLREIMHKPLNLSIVKRVIDDCRELGIASDVSILIGLPGETKQDIEDARAFLKTLDATWFRISMATPLVGSEMLDICIKKNYLKGSYIDGDFKNAIIETEDFTAEYLQSEAYALNLELNFVGNSDLRLGHYETALKGFENVIKVKSDHAFAFYYGAQCCNALGSEEKCRAYKARYREIVETIPFWSECVKRYGLEPSV